MKFTKFEIRDLEIILKKYIEFVKKSKEYKSAKDKSELYSYVSAHTLLSKITGELTKEEKKRRKEEIKDLKRDIKEFKKDIEREKKKCERRILWNKKVIKEKRKEIKELGGK